jgi:hypothetical protein
LLQIKRKKIEKREKESEEKSERAQERYTCINIHTYNTNEIEKKNKKYIYIYNNK